MAKLIHITNVSLDGYVEDAQGRFAWTEPSDDVFAFITDIVRPIGTHVYGRRMYETMAVWETDPSLAAQSPLMAEFANVWQAADKVVYSTTLREPLTAHTRLESRFDADAIRDVKHTTDADITVGGAGLAAEAFRAELIDECHVLVYPVVVGGGKHAFPRDARIDLELRDEHRFDDGVVHLHYGVTT